MTLQHLKEKSLRLYEGMPIKVVVSAKCPLELSKITTKFTGRRVFAMNNSTVCFIDKDSDAYVIPYTRDVIITLVENGFQPVDFYVPLSTLETPPPIYVARWEALRKQAKLSRAKDFEDDCEKWCDEHQIGAIESTWLVNSIEIPFGGILVEGRDYKTVYYPIVKNMVLDDYATENIGTFNTNNGRTVYVYRNGRTYVYKGHAITHALTAAGYKENFNLFVPFSNGDFPANSPLRERWEMLPKNAGAKKFK